MAFKTDFLEMMVSAIIIKALTTRDQYGAPTFSTPVSGVPAHISYRTKAVRTSSEDRVLSTATVQLPPPGFIFGTVTIPLVHEGDEVTLPNDGITRHVLVAAVHTDDTGPHHQELQLT